MDIDKEHKKLVLAKEFITKLDALQDLAIGLHYLEEEERTPFNHKEFFECIFDGVFPEGTSFETWGMTISICREMAEREIELQTEFVRSKKFEIDSINNQKKATEAKVKYQKLLEEFEADYR